MRKYTHLCLYDYATKKSYSNIIVLVKVLKYIVYNNVISLLHTASFIFMLHPFFEFLMIMNWDQMFE